MYLGRLVEIADSDELYDNPLHPYTKALLSAIPVPDPDLAAQSQRMQLKGELPSPMDVPRDAISTPDVSMLRKAVVSRYRK